MTASRERIRARNRIGQGASRRRRVLVVSVLAGLLTVLAAVVSLGLGDYPLSPGQVLAALAGEGSRRDLLVLRTVRLPRVLTGVAVGAALALAGAITQTVARNALASPDLLGVTAGASAGAAAVITLGGTASASGFLREVGVPTAAIAGAAVATTAVLVLVRAHGTTGTQPLLMGIGVSAFFTGIVSLLLIAAPIRDAARANVWLTGSLNQRSWPEFWPILVTLAVAVVVLVPLTRTLGALHLGPDVARATGTRVGRTAGAVVVVSVVLTAVSAAAAGPLGFVALVAPQLARLVCRTTRPPLVASALLGALIVVVSDLLARTLFAPVQIPSGAVIAVVGAPFLVWLLIIRRRRTAL